jgi:acyl-coenzyme A thioesterase PaaI-like protein
MEWTMDIGAQALSIQEALYPELTRFGCGHANPDGFHLRSYRDGQVTVATFTPRAEHDNGFGFLNGGIVTTVLDYHTAAVVMWEADRHDWKADIGAPVPFITAGFEVRFLRPTPLGPPVSLRAEPVEISERAFLVNAELAFEGKVRATMVANWKRFHPRYDKRRRNSHLPGQAWTGRK